MNSSKENEAAIDIPQMNPTELDEIDANITELGEVNANITEPGEKDATITELGEVDANQTNLDTVDAYGYDRISQSEEETEKKQRIININSPQPDKYCQNKISTAKYTILLFLPKFLLEQFRKYANLFFLLIAILQQIPNVSPTGKFTTVVPLVIILTISAIKEIIEDIKRHKADESTNNGKMHVLKNHKWEEIRWQDLEVGNIIKLENGHGIPADIVLLASSEPHAMCYIETSNLDGETNFKMRQGLSQTSEIRTISDLAKMESQITCEVPNKHLYEYCGNISIGNKKYSLNNDQLLLRGATLKNTKWIFGIAIYTGHETKVMLNSIAAPLKRSAVDKMANIYILVLCGILLFLTIFSCVANYIWIQYNMATAWYLGFDRLPASNFGLMILTAFIMFHTLIPISLQVTLEMVRFVQAYFISMDIEMYDSVSDTPANARNSNLTDELGRVKYIFSDKTGTLTRNVMEFKQCSIAGIVYGQNIAGNESAIQDTNLLKGIEHGDPDIDIFFRALAVCHTVVPEKDDNGDIFYQASSPDENALVKAAKQMGFIFHTRTPDYVYINVREVDYKFQILNVLEFTSLRKRMSVIVRTPESKIILFTKGADNVIFERLSPDSRDKESTLEHLEEFAKIGLRTLCIAYREIDPAQYECWQTEFHAASVAIRNREQKLSEAAEKIENNLILVGASAIEDKLQDQVPETIANLLKAGITIWVLTGDKKETAINIGYSCQLLTPTMSLRVLDSNSLDGTRDRLNQIITEFGDNLEKENNIGFIVTGDALKYAVDSEISKDFLKVAFSCKSVICCRVSPSQKAEVVVLVTSHAKNKITLAIGDGANDVSMIQAAHIGVGISGMEGQQAVCNSDFAIAQFKFLNRLLLVHGAWNYSRITKFILYSFYKNACFFIIHFWFGMLSGFSGQILFDRWAITFYNVMFTGLPPIALGLFDRSCTANNLLKYPELYKDVLKSSGFNVKIFLTWILNSIYHSLGLFWLTVLITNHDILFPNGQTGSLLFLGNCIYTYVVVTVSIKAGVEHIAWTVFSHLAIWGSIASWFVFFIIFSYIFQLTGFSPGMALMYKAVFTSGTFWLGLILIPAAALTRDISWKAFKRTFYKSIRELVMEKEKVYQDPGDIIKKSESAKEKKKNWISKTNRRRQQTNPMPTDEISHGFAFSQEENGPISQADFIRQIDTTKRKSEGN